MVNNSKCNVSPPLRRSRPLHVPEHHLISVYQCYKPQTLRCVSTVEIYYLECFLFLLAPVYILR
jgi:hypothetical protein